MAKALVKLRKMVASSAEFKTQTGSGTVDEALQHVYLRDVTGEDQPRPLAVVSVGDDFRYGQSGGGSFNYLRPAGQLGLFMLRNTPTQYYEDQNAGEIDAWNFFGNVLMQIAALSAADDATSEFGESHLSITDMQVTQWGENDRELWPTLGRFYFCVLAVSWGDGSI